MNDAIEKFHEFGYAVLPKIISPEKIDRIFSELDTLMAMAIQNKGDAPEKFPGVDAKYTYLKENYPTMKSHVYDLMKHLDAVQSVANQSDIIAFLHKLATTPVLVDNILIRMDDKSNDRLRPYHQEGLGQISYKSYNLWIPLRDVNLATGTMKFIPKTHQQGYVPHKFYENFGNYHGICEEYIDESKVEHAILQRGDALFFHPCLFHGSAPMTKDTGMRWTLIARYNSLFEVPYLSQDDAPKHIPQIAG